MKIRNILFIAPIFGLFFTNIAMAQKYDGAQIACKNGNKKAFLEAISINEATFNKYVPKILTMGTKDVVSGAVYEVQNEYYELLFPFKSYNDGSWIEYGTADDLKPIYADVNIVEKTGDDIVVRFQRGDYDYKDGKRSNEMSFKYGTEKEMTFKRANKNQCWKLDSIFNLQY